MKKLTHRELEVLRLVAKGLSIEEISEKLVVTHHTTKSHITNIYKTLEAHNRIQAIYIALQQGYHINIRKNKKKIM